jgi:hypothetical protein
VKISSSLPQNQLQALLRSSLAKLLNTSLMEAIRDSLVLWGTYWCLVQPRRTQNSPLDCNPVSWEVKPPSPRRTGDSPCTSPGSSWTSGRVPCPAARCWVSQHVDVHISVHSEAGSKMWGGMSPLLLTTPRTITIAGNMMIGASLGSSHSHLLFLELTF